MSLSVSDMDGDAEVTPSSLHASDECGERSDEAEAEAEASRAQCAQLITPANSSRARYSVCDREGVEGGVEDMVVSPEEMQLVPSASSSTATPPMTVMAMARIDTKEVAVESSDSDSSVVRSVPPSTHCHLLNTRLSIGRISFFFFGGIAHKSILASFRHSPPITTPDHPLTFSRCRHIYAAHYPPCLLPDLRPSDHLRR